MSSLQTSLLTFWIALLTHTYCIRHEPHADVVGFPGIACRHCYGGNGSGRFFPLTLKTFSDVSKSIHVLRNHLVKCPKAPAGLAGGCTLRTSMCCFCSLLF